MKLGTKISLSFCFILIVVIVVASATFMYYKDYNTDSKKSSKESTLEWGDVYLKILKDDDNFKELQEIKLQVCDIDNNEVPELIVYGKKTTESGKEKNLAKIYRINEEDKVDTVQFELDEEYGMEFLYNNEEDEANWYVVTEENQTVYEIQVEDKNYEIEKSDYKYDEDFTVIDEGEKIDFDPQNDKPKEIIQEVKDIYVPTEEYASEVKSIKKKNKESKKEEKVKTVEDNEKDNIEESSSNENTKTKNIENYEDKFVNFMKNSSYELCDPAYNSYGESYLYFLDLNLNNVPELYIFGEQGQYYDYGRLVQLEMYEGEVINAYNPYSSDHVTLVKNDNGDYCYYEIEGRGTPSGVDKSVMLTNTKSKEKLGVSYRPQDITSKPYNFYSSNIINNPNGEWTEIEIDQFEKMLNDYEKEYKDQNDFLEDYRVKLDSTKNEDIIKSIPEAYEKYEKLMNMLS